jgi:GMP synthase (glutamine-hydrolysing)
MGGPMSVNDEEKYLWLAKEKSFIQNAIAGNRKVIGICLGAQLIAAALGKSVFRNKEREIGWFPVTFTPEIRNTYLFDHFPDSAVVFHWHGETFDLPDGAYTTGFIRSMLTSGISLWFKCGGSSVSS